MRDDEEFKDDCASWLGYKPCAVQGAAGLANCAACTSYTPLEPQILLPPRSRFDPGALEAAKTVGIIEMGGLGSVLRTTAVSRVLRAQPGRTIYWFTHKRGIELLRYVPSVHPIDVENRDLESARVGQLDMVLNFEQSPAAKELAIASRIVGGFDVNAQERFRPASEHARYFQRMQIDDVFRQLNRRSMQEVLLGSVGLEEHPARYQLAVPRDHRERSRELLHELIPHDRSGHFIALNIGTSRRGELKRWPAQLWARLATRLADGHRGRSVLLLSGPEDADIRQKVAKYLRRNPRDNVAMGPGDLSIGDFISLVDKADVMVTGDTFAMHVARARRVPTVVLAGPMPAGELEIGRRDRVIGPKLPCAPCYYHCNQIPIGACMQSISPRDVLEMVSEVVRDRSRISGWSRSVPRNDVVFPSGVPARKMAARQRQSDQGLGSGMR